MATGAQLLSFNLMFLFGVTTGRRCSSGRPTARVDAGWGDRSMGVDSIWRG